MRRIFILLLCCVALVGTVFADSRADAVRNSTIVRADGTAQVSLAVEITLTDSVEGLTFPLPKDADDVTLNGAPVETKPSRSNSGVELVDLSYLDGVTGKQKLTFTYTLPAVVGFPDEDDDVAEDALMLRVPLLSGFEYPVEAMSFTVTLPEGVEGAPSFYSGYFLQSIESNLTYKFAGGIVSGSVTEVMKDKETLLMTMAVTQEMFPQVRLIENEENLHLYAMSALTGLALVFWLIFLHSLPVYPRRRTTPPVGIHAGEISSRLTLGGGDLTMMVFQWAQLGYIRIVPDKRDRVWLHKRMEMGNERSAFEVRCFNQLFGRNQSVEGTGSRYARLWQQVRSTMDHHQLITRGGLWARPVFRCLAMLVSALAGASMGTNLLEEGPWRIPLAVGLAVLGCVTAWLIQGGTVRIQRRERDGVFASVLCCLLWLGVSFFADRPLAGLISTAVQLLAGVLTTWGGRRTRFGWGLACELQGFRRYLKRAKREEIKAGQERDPEYFFEMIPYAMAFGVEKSFAKAFGGRILQQCGYMDAGRASRRTAMEWTRLMVQTAEKLDTTGKKAHTYRRR